MRLISLLLAGLGLLTALAVTACAGEGDPLGIGNRQVSVVYFGELPMTRDPLWGDLPSDQGPIRELLSALKDAWKVGESAPWPSDAWGFPDLLYVRYVDGTSTAILPSGVDLWDIREVAKVRSPALTAWFGRISEYMPEVRVRMFNAPASVRSGETLVVTGDGLVDDGTARVALDLEGGSPFSLGEATVDHGSYRWEGPLPAGVPSGKHTLFVDVPGVRMSDPLEVLPPAPVPSPTATRPCPWKVLTPEDERAQFECHPEAYKFTIDQETVVMFTYPTEALDFAGFASIHHIPSVSSFALNPPSFGGTLRSYGDQQVAITKHYQSEAGRTRLEAVLADEGLMGRILAYKGALATSMEEFHVRLNYELDASLPRRVTLFADITGGEDDSPELYCKETRWYFGDGTVSETLPDCGDWKPGVKGTRHLETTYGYKKPGEYVVTFSYGNLKGGPITVRVAW